MASDYMGIRNGLGKHLGLPVTQHQDGPTPDLSKPQMLCLANTLQNLFGHNSMVSFSRTVYSRAWEECSDPDLTLGGRQERQ